MTNQQPFHTILAKARQKSGFGQRQLAAIVDVAPSVVSRLERGIIEPHDEMLIIKLADTLHVRPQTLMAARWRRLYGEVNANFIQNMLQVRWDR